MKIKSLISSVLAIVISLGMLGLAWHVATEPTSGVSLFAARTKPAESVPPRMTQEELNAFFDTSVRPALTAFYARNQVALDRVAERISSGLETSRAGVPAFVEDVTGWGSRFGIIRRSATDLWHEWRDKPAQANELRQYVADKFEAHVFSDASLKALIADALRQFQDDLEASRNKLHADVRAAWTGSALPLSELDVEQLTRSATASVQNITVNMAQNSVVLGGLSLVAGFALEAAAEKLVMYLLNSVAVGVATSSTALVAASGGATGSFALMGSGGGTMLGGPGVGTAAGAAIGLAVGLVVDWWATDALAEKLTDECTDMVRIVEHQILFGSQDNPGLKSILGESVRILGQAEMSAIQSTLQEELQ